MILNEKEAGIQNNLLRCPIVHKLIPDENDFGLSTRLVEVIFVVQSQLCVAS